MDLHLTRGVGMGMPSPITYQEIESYQRLRQIQLDPIEVQLLKIADAAFLAQFAENSDIEGGRAVATGVPPHEREPNA